MNSTDRQLIEKNVQFAGSCEEAAERAHAIAVLTEWDEFRNADFDSIYAKMNQPAFIFDGRNVLDRVRLALMGFESHGIGVS